MRVNASAGKVLLPLGVNAANGKVLLPLWVNASTAENVLLLQIQLSLLLVVLEVSDLLLFPALVLPPVHAQADAFDQLLGLVTVERYELRGPAGGHGRIERPRLLLVELG